MNKQSEEISLDNLIILIIVCIFIISIGYLYIGRLKIKGNEAFALASVVTISTSQAGFQGGACVDQDGDGIGEFGLLGEITTMVEPRPTKWGKLKVELMPKKFAPPINCSYATVAGYNYQIFLPHTKEPVTDTGKSQKGSTDQSSIDAQEKRCVVYAWPNDSRSGQRCFAFGNSIASLFASNLQKNSLIYVGSQSPAYNAAMPLSKVNTITTVKWVDIEDNSIWETDNKHSILKIVQPITGIDGQEWQVVESLK